MAGYVFTPKFTNDVARSMLDDAIAHRPNRSGLMWSIYDMEVLLWHACRIGPHEGQEIGAPAFPEVIDKLKAHGLLVDGESLDHPYRVTPLGDALIQMWKDTPVPVIRFVDPRLEATDGPR